jgi:hypothetical protein
MALTPEQIQSLLGKTRVKGDYVMKLNAFDASGEQGVNVSETWPELAGKKATTLKQGFENAKQNKDFNGNKDSIRVISNDDLVYLIKVDASVDGAEADGAVDAGAGEAFAEPVQAQ